MNCSVDERSARLRSATILPPRREVFKPLAQGLGYSLDQVALVVEVPGIDVAGRVVLPQDAIRAGVVDVPRHDNAPAGGRIVVLGRLHLAIVHEPGLRGAVRPIVPLLCAWIVNWSVDMGTLAAN